MDKNEMKVRCLIIDIEKRADKNGKDYWIIRTKLEPDTRQDYFAFSTDYQLAPKTLSLLDNYPEKIVNSWAVLTIRKREEREKVVAIEVKE